MTKGKKRSMDNLKKPLKSALKQPKTKQSSKINDQKHIDASINLSEDPKYSRTSKDQNYSKVYSLWNIWVASFFLKCLLFLSYHSTDFDVHRNWLSITHNLPLSQWYVEKTSQWTLDYPPFFAYFEYFLSWLVPSQVKNDGCLLILETGDYGVPTIIFQRLTVILSELVLYGALQWYINTSPLKDRTKSFVVAASLVLSPSILIVDHIHFQYNGMMFGILVLVINSARLEKYLMCGFWFSVLLCFKHIFLYLAPAVFFFLLRVYCLNFTQWPKDFKSFVGLIYWKNLAKLGSIVLGVFFVAFAPFVYYGVMSDLLGRLFPFSRGLTHTYWAPNIWSLYSFVDKVLYQLFQHLPVVQRLPYFKSLILEPNTSLTRGILGDIKFSILPTITPQITFILTIFYQMLGTLPLLTITKPTHERFISSLTLCAFASFLFGWHVHEKAVMTILFPFTFLAPLDKRILRPFFLLASCANVSLFPLIFTSAESFLKSTYTFVWCVIFFISLSQVCPSLSNTRNKRIFFLDRVAMWYIYGLVLLVLSCGVFDIAGYRVDLFAKYRFLELILISVYCAIGIVSSWNAVSWLYFADVYSLF